MLRTGVFLDRDDTIIRDVPYLSDPEQIELLPEVPAAIRLLNENTIPVIIITNQSGIARGLLDEEILSAIHERLVGLLAAKVASIDAIYYCPHHPAGTVAAYAMACACRKPAPGLLLRAALDFDLDLPRCNLVGDNAIDIETIQRVGGKGILLSPSDGPRIATAHTRRTIGNAIHWIMEDLIP